MAHMKKTFTLFLLLSLFSVQTLACGKRSTDNDDGESTNTASDSEGRNSGTSTSNACCVCGQMIDVKIIANNQVKEPYFTIDTDVLGMPQQHFINMLQAAGDKDRRFRFSADYFGSLGFMVNKLNGVSANVADKTYWQLIDNRKGEGMALGVSHYMPMHQDEIMFNFTTWG